MGPTEQYEIGTHGREVNPMIPSNTLFKGSVSKNPLGV